MNNSDIEFIKRMLKHMITYFSTAQYYVMSVIQFRGLYISLNKSSNPSKICKTFYYLLSFKKASRIVHNQLITVIHHTYC